MTVYLDRLAECEQRGAPLRVLVVGAGGSMGRGIALQLGKTPGLRLAAAVDLDLAGARAAAALNRRPWMEATTDDEISRALSEGHTIVAADARPILERGTEVADVLVESTNTVAFAFDLVSRALELGLDAVLMNAEVDCLLGPTLHARARSAGRVVTSDAGDQHGVLLRMIEEVRLWGFDVAMAGNIKGFLDRYATPERMVDEARKRRLDPVMCVAYTDGTKLSIEMALVANATGLVPVRRGMLGPRAEHVRDVFTQFDLEALPAGGVVDYVLGAEPGGGVFVVARCDDPEQREYLRYYKMGEGPFYLAYRPYHLCHLETPYAIARAVLDREPVLRPLAGPVARVVATAKQDLPTGTVLTPAIGGPFLYGEIDRAEVCDREGGVPICLLEDAGAGPARVVRRVKRDRLLTWDDIDLPESDLVEAYRRQCAEEPARRAGASR